MKKTKLVNWHGRMKISSEHFRQTENYFIDQLIDCRAILRPKYGYGLLPLHAKNQGVGIQIREGMSDHIEVRLYSCSAITASGERIDFRTADYEEPLTKIYSPHHDTAQVRNWAIILIVNPYKRVLCGALNSNEDPPRHPDCDSFYKLEIVASDQLNTTFLESNSLIIGQIRKDGERYVVDTNYIPPCMSMSSHAVLAEYCKTFDAYLYSIRKSAKEIIAKVYNRQNNGELAIHIRVMSEVILQYISSISFRLKNIGTSISPLSMSEYISTLASHIFVSLSCQPSVRKDELLKYFYEWSDITPGSFEKLLAETMDLVYDHQNICLTMVSLETYIKNLCELLERLSRLEYIGQHKESLVVSISGGESRHEERRGFMVSD